MAKDYKYPDYTPVDEPVGKRVAPQKPGSGIRVDGKPIKDTPPNILAEAADNTVKMLDRKSRAEGFAKPPADGAETSKTNAMGDTYKKGGHVHHSEHYGKHAGGHKLHMDHVKAMCGGGYAKAKK